MPEDFPESVKDDAFENAGRRCECTRLKHGHYGRCPKTFLDHWDTRFHHIDSFSPATLSNCEVLCIECHAKTQSYGRPKS